MRTKFLVWLLMGFLVFPALSLAQQKKQYQKVGVERNQAESEAHSASIVLGLNLGSFSLGEDPCTREAKNRYSPKSEYSNINLGKLPSQPSIQIGRSGQAMEGGEGQATEGESDEFHEKGREVIKNEMEAYGEDILNNNDKGAKDHLETAQHVNEETTKADMEKVKNSPDPSPEDLNNLAADHYTGIMIGGDPEFYHEALMVLADGMTRSSSTSDKQKDFWSKVKDGRTPAPDWATCDHPVCKSARERTKDIREVLHDIAKAKIGKGGLIGSRGLGKGPTPSKTYPGESTKSGYRKEKESKVSKGGQITNPSGEKGTGYPSGFDFCGRHLPSPEEYAKMGFDPGRITDPVDRSWNGRIEQVQNQRTLVWSKTVKRADGSFLRVEKRYQNGSVSAVSYQFYGKDGAKIGYINYDAKTGKIDGVRLK